mgnify:CR=1 FL=1
MLRASAAQTNRSVSLKAVTDLSIDSQLKWGRELLAFTDAAVTRDAQTMALARESLVLVGGLGAVVRAAGCVGTFQMMNRLMDTLGVRVDASRLALAAELGITVPTHLRPRSTPGPT